MSDVNRIREALLSKWHSRPMRDDDLLSSGSTLLNLACSGRAAGAFLKGHYYFFCGDSASGKTWIGLTCFAEAVLNPNFSEYRFIYDSVEMGALMDIERYFGKAVVERLETPSRSEPYCSRTVQDFYRHLDDAIKLGKPFIYVLDSQDALSSEEEIKTFQQQRTKSIGSYGDAKARYHSGHIRQVLGPLSDLGSILIILNQTRESFDPFESTTYSGGRALLFYATIQLWSKINSHIVRVVRGKKRELGIISKIRVKKNRLTGKDRTVLVPIYHSFGIDDIGSMVDFLVDENVWTKRGDVITVPDPPLEARRERLIKIFEDRRDELVALVQKVWDEIEQACEVKRKRRYQ